MAVPRISQVQPGASVSIVLKADQRTGREVQGKVQDVLTRGDHPRGIKVRLADGRIGRVQRMFNGHLPGAAPAATITDFIAASHPAAHSDRAAQPGPASPLTSSFMVRNEGTTQGRGVARGQHPRYRDVRLDEPLEQPAEEMDLMAYVKPAKQKKGKKVPQHEVVADRGGVSESTPASTTAIATASCPVCNDFEGDEAAVSNHVEKHFT